MPSWIVSPFAGWTAVRGLFRVKIAGKLLEELVGKWITIKMTA
jgi:hypothetical protein